MNSFLSWIGGKKALSKEIVNLFPYDYNRYVEVFGGAGWVLFRKPPRRDFEVYNDINGELVNLYRVVQSRKKSKRMLELLENSLNSREEFDRIKKALESGVRMSDVRRAAYFYQQIRYSYGAGLDSFASQPHDIRSNFPLIRQATARLANVVIEHQSFDRLIPHLDRKGTIFYCDPPYHNTEQFYKNTGGFNERHHVLLRDDLLTMEGYFLLSYNDDEYIRELYDHPGIYIVETKRMHNLRQRFEAGAEFPELLIANYDIRDPTQLLMGQTTLF